MLGLREIGRLPLILPSVPHPIRSLLEAEAARAGVALCIAHETDAVVPSMDLVADGLGFSVVPNNMMRADLDTSRFHWHRLAGRQLSTALCIVVPARVAPGTLAAAAAIIVRDVLGRVLASVHAAVR